jgi:hypothetical protein
MHYYTKPQPLDPFSLEKLLHSLFALEIVRMAVRQPEALFLTQLSFQEEAGGRAGGTSALV